MTAKRNSILQILNQPKTNNDFAVWLAHLGVEALAVHGWTPSALSKTLESNLSVALYEVDTLVACLIYHQVDALQFEVLFLATAPQWRRKGYQEALLLHFFKAHPGAGLWLECRADNQAALSLYKKCGFIEAGVRPGYYNDGMAAILMSFLPLQDPL